MSGISDRQQVERMTPAEALGRLAEGNVRFRNNTRANRDLMAQVAATAGGQHPFAVVLSCIDSRTPAELLFDLGLGDIFSVRVAGNVLNEDVLGSLEFACQLAGAKLIVVLGHSACGAVRGACEGARLGHLTGLLHKLQPAIEQVDGQGAAAPADGERIQQVAERNVEHVVKTLRARSEVLDALISGGSVGLVGAMYDVQTGAVAFAALDCGSPG